MKNGSGFMQVRGGRLHKGPCRLLSPGMWRRQTTGARQTARQRPMDVKWLSGLVYHIHSGCVESQKMGKAGRRAHPSEMWA